MHWLTVSRMGLETSFFFPRLWRKCWCVWHAGVRIKCLYTFVCVRLLFWGLGGWVGSEDRLCAVELLCLFLVSVIFLLTGQLFVVSFLLCVPSPTWQISTTQLWTENIIWMDGTDLAPHPTETVPSYICLHDQDRSVNAYVLILWSEGEGHCTTVLLRFAGVVVVNYY